MSKVLVTGGAGYIGSHVVKALGDLGHTVLDHRQPVKRRSNNLLMDQVNEGAVPFQLTAQKGGTKDWMDLLASPEKLQVVKEAIESVPPPPKGRK